MISESSAEIPLDDIYWVEPLDSPIVDITPEQIQNMATSILVHGQIEEIVVNVADEKGKHRGVIGRLRYEGMKERWKDKLEGITIRARIRKFRDEVEILVWQLAENLHRREVSAMAKALRYKKIYDLLQEKTIVTTPESTVSTLAKALEELTGEEAAEKTVYHYLNLTDLAPETQKILTSEKWGLRHGLELLRVKDPKKQVKLAQRAASYPKCSVQDLKYMVDEVISEERGKKRDKQLEKKVKELAEQGIMAITDKTMDWNKHHKFWGEPPPPCDTCERKGVFLERNFQQRAICVDPKCYEQTEKDRRRKEQAELKAREAELTVERAKIYAMEPDERHWKMVLVAFIDDYRLAQKLGIPTREKYLAALWKRVLDMSGDEVKRLLVREAVENIMTGPLAYERNEHVKEWAIKEFDLRRELFLSEGERRPLPPYL